MAGLTTESPRRPVCRPTQFRIFTEGTTPQVWQPWKHCAERLGLQWRSFFADDDMIEVTPEIKLLVEKWSALSDEQKAVLWQLFRSYGI